MAFTTETLLFAICTIAFAAGLYFWQRHRCRRTKKLNTLDLVGDGDDVELLKAIEEAFGIKVKNSDAETLHTVGQLYALVSQHLENRTDFDPVWALVCQIAREHSGSPDPIDKDTSFFSQHAQARNPNARNT